MSTQSRPGRKPTKEHDPDFKRVIPLTLRHAEVKQLDAAAKKVKMSRSAWCRYVLIWAATGKAPK